MFFFHSEHILTIYTFFSLNFVLLQANRHGWAVLINKYITLQLGFRNMYLQRKDIDSLNIYI